MDNYIGKKILIIGANAFFLDVVKNCKKKGIITIILDDNPNAVSKLTADIALNVDTYDKDAVLAVAMQYQVDGVFVGWSDHNLYTARYVADKMGLPFYATQEQLDYTTNKENFKALCIKNNVPVFPEISINDDCIYNPDTYPLIVKPTDSAGSKGITICHNQKELIDAYAAAREISFTGTAIIEKAVNYKHLNIYYTLAAGEIYLSAMCDRYVHYVKPDFPPLPVLLIHPSKYLKLYEEKADKAVKKMFQDIGMENGVAFVQAFVDEQSGEFYIYEMGYRLNGGSTYFLMDYFSHFNQIEMLIHYALFGNMGDLKALKNVSPYYDKPGFMMVVSACPGKIKSISGIEEIEKLENIICTIPMYRPGETVKASSGVSQAQIFMYIFLTETRLEDVKITAGFIKAHLKVISDYGKDMLLDTWNVIENL